jgi:hypothetical protein
MTDIVAELRAETKRILARHYGGIPDAIAAIRVSTVARIDAYVTEAEDRAAACTCREPEAFVIPTRRDKPLHAMFLARRLERMRVEEAG